MKNSIIFFLLIYLNLTASLFSNEIKILYKVNDGVITNQDVIEEMNYLVSLNQNLSQLDTSQISSNAQRSLIREKIKKDEVEKYFNIDYTKAINSKKLEYLIENFRKKIGFNSNEDFKSYLISKNIVFDELKKKFVIEQFWNTLVFEKYHKLIKVDTNKINNRLDEIMKNNSEIFSFNLSEIIFAEKDKGSIEKKYKEIVSSIKTIGFKDAAVIHSVSESSKFGGEIGWINQNQISKKIFLTIKDLNIGEFSKPIITAGGIILLKVNDKKKVTAEIDRQKEIEKLISYEKERLLNEYSIIYYKEIENLAYVEKF